MGVKQFDYQAQVQFYAKRLQEDCVDKGYDTNAYVVGYLGSVVSYAGDSAEEKLLRVQAMLEAQKLVLGRG